MSRRCDYNFLFTWVKSKTLINESFCQDVGDLERRFDLQNRITVVHESESAFINVSEFVECFCVSWDVVAEFWVKDREIREPCDEPSIGPIGIGRVDGLPGRRWRTGAKDKPLCSYHICRAL